MNLDLVAYPGESDTTMEITNLAGTVVATASGTEIQSTLYRFVVTLADGYYRFRILDANDEVFSAGAIHVVSNVLIGQDRQVENLQRDQADREAVAAIELNPVIAPVIGYADTRIQQTVVPLYIGDTATRSITLVDSTTGDPVDIESIGLQLVVETVKKGDVKAYADNELTKSENTVSFVPTSAMVASERTLNFALKVAVSGHPLAWGIMPVTYVPRSGSS